MKTNKEALIESFTNSTRRMAAALVHSDDWGYWWEEGVCDDEDEAIRKEIRWLKRKYVEPKPQPKPDTTVSIPISIAEYVRRREANP